MKTNLRFNPILSGFFVFIFLVSCSEEQETYTIVKKDIVESVYSSVMVEPESMYKVNAVNPGYIDEVMVEIGDEVDLEQVLFSVRDVQSNSSASNAKLNLEMARSNYSGNTNLINDLKLELEDAELKKENDSVNYVRNKSLYEKGLLTKIEMEQTELAYSSSKTRCRLLANRIKRSKADLKASLDQAMNNYTSTLSHSNDAFVRNRIKGQVYDLFKEEGEFVSVQEPVLIVGSKDQFVVKMKIDEVDITKVSLNQRIIISLESYKNQTFEGKVTRISPKMDAQTQTFEIEGVFIDRPKSLFMGLTGEGNIIITKRKNALVVPIEYLVDDTFVITESGKKKIKIGTRSLSHIEVLSGLKEGDKILKAEQ